MGHPHHLAPVAALDGEQRLWIENKDCGEKGPIWIENAPQET